MRTNLLDRCFYGCFLHGDRHHIAVTVTNIVALFFKAIVNLIEFHDALMYVNWETYSDKRTRFYEKWDSFNYVRGKTFGQCLLLAIPILGLNCVKGTKEKERAFHLQMAIKHLPCLELSAFETYTKEGQEDWKFIADVAMTFIGNKKCIPSFFCEKYVTQKALLELVKANPSCLDFVIDRCKHVVDLGPHDTIMLTNEKNENVKFVWNLLKTLAEKDENLSSTELWLKVTPLLNKHIIVDFYQDSGIPNVLGHGDVDELSVLKKWMKQCPVLMKKIYSDFIEEEKERSVEILKNVFSDLSDEEVLSLIKEVPDSIKFIDQERKNNSSFLKKVLMTDPRLFDNDEFKKVVVLDGWKDLLESIQCTSKEQVEALVKEMLRKDAVKFFSCMHQLVEEGKVQEKKEHCWFKQYENNFNRLSVVFFNIKNDFNFCIDCCYKSIEVFQYFNWGNDNILRNAFIDADIDLFMKGCISLVGKEGYEETLKKLCDESDPIEKHLHWIPQENSDRKDKVDSFEYYLEAFDVFLKLEGEEPKELKKKLVESITKKQNLYPENEMIKYSYIDGKRFILDPKNIKQNQILDPRIRNSLFKILDEICRKTAYRNMIKRNPGFLFLAGREILEDEIFMGEIFNEKNLSKCLSKQQMKKVITLFLSLKTKKIKLPKFLFFQILKMGFSN